MARRFNGRLLAENKATSTGLLPRRSDADQRDERDGNPRAQLAARGQECQASHEIELLLERKASSG
jgi:hypothetical protein